MTTPEHPHHAQPPSGVRSIDLGMTPQELAAAQHSPPSGGEAQQAPGQHTAPGQVPGHRTWVGYLLWIIAAGLVMNGVESLLGAIGLWGDASVAAWAPMVVTIAVGQLLLGVALAVVAWALTRRPRSQKP